MKKIKLLSSLCLISSIFACTVSTNKIEPTSNTNSINKDRLISNSPIELNNTFEESKALIIGENDFQLINPEKENSFNTKATVIPEPFILYKRSASISYVLTLSFMKTLKQLIADGLLNKSDISKLLLKATKPEKEFITYITSFEQVPSMPNLIQDDLESKTLSFVVSKNLNITSEFLKNVYSKVTNTLDNAFEKTEMESIYNLPTTNNDEKTYLTNFLSTDGFNNKPLLDNLGKFILIPKLYNYYVDDMLVHGNTDIELLSNVSQADRILETLTDNARCGAGALFNALIYMKGKDAFFPAATAIGTSLVGTTFTYRNIHLAQEKLMSVVGANQLTGLTIIPNATSTSVASGTVQAAATKLGLILGPNFLTKSTGTAPTYTDSLKKYFTDNPNATLFVSSNIASSGTISFSSTLPNNHWVLLTSKKILTPGATPQDPPILVEKYYVTNTGGRNGTGKNHYELSDADFKVLTESNKFLTPLNLDIQSTAT